MNNSLDITPVSGKLSTSETSIYSIQQHFAVLRNATTLSETERMREKLLLDSTQITSRSSALSTLNSELSALKQIAEDLSKQRIIEKGGGLRVEVISFNGASDKLDLASDFEDGTEVAFSANFGALSPGQTYFVAKSGGDYQMYATRQGALDGSNSLLIDFESTDPVEDLTIFEVNANTAKDEIKAFIDQYNKVQTQLESATAKGGVLFGERSIVGLASSLRQGIRSIFNSSQLSAGISSSKSGSTLEVDDTALKNGIAENVGAALDYLQSADGQGLATKTVALLSPFVRSGGILSNRISLLDRNLEKIDRQLNRLTENEGEKQQEVLDLFSNVAKAMLASQKSLNFVSLLGSHRR